VKLGVSRRHTRTGARTLHALCPGELLAILGRNGSGKTLTLHTLAGLRAPAAGAVSLDGAALAGQKRRAIALRLGLLPQDLEDAFVTTAMETVLIGRHPHLALWQWETAADNRLHAQRSRRCPWVTLPSAAPTPSPW